MPANEKEELPSEVDLRHAEEAEFVLLCRVLAGLRRLSTSETPQLSTGVSMFRDTAKLIDAIQATQTRTGLLALQLRDGTATADEQRQVADKVEELLDLLQSHAADTDSGIAPTPRRLHLTERRPA
ncbi:hypothetical protein OG439_20120 [Amycolatopsis sp. NBC_01307]|uniref:hypothetical protein n=1 Tax=Amycolatopsis sp. NBC_01307 TaxID=2903561 RepID=UPI002E15ACF5|nr:hypothetical protein OG439_20120 [Amycolatopsis sp. NBC_01307]